MAEGVDLDQGFYRSATLVGCTPILMWSLLAALTVATGAVPPFQLAAVCFAIGGALGLTWASIRGELRLLTGQPLSVWLHGVGGIFRFHFFFHSVTSRLTGGSQPYRLSLAAADRIILCGVAGPPIEGTPRCGRCVGTRRCCCNRAWLGGRGLIITEPVGYLAAGACALIWSAYSASNRIFSKVPTSLVTGLCLISSFLAGICHLLFEQALWPQTTLAWWAVLGLGVGPVGLAFFVWDYGCKQGDLRVLGAGAYLAPLLSTAALLALGLESPRLSIILAAFLIAGGAMIAARNLIRRRSSASR